jgi:hypothetical protein
MKAIGIIALIATITIPGSSFAWGPRGGGVVIRPFFPGAIGGRHFGRVPASIFINRALFPPSLFFPPALHGSYYPSSYAYPAYAYPAPYPYYNNYYSVPPPASVGTAYERAYSEGYARGYEEALRENRRERYDEETKRGREQGQDDAKGGE